MIFIIYKTFIAANTCKGFHSYFEELIRDETLNRVYLIKGGPGSGKSTLMKKVSKKADALGLTVENLYCSSDPDSLDGVRIIEKGIVIIDATAPHAFDMKYPGARESLVDLSAFWDEQSLSENYSKIKALTDSISKRYKSVYGLLKIAGIANLKRSAVIESKVDFDKCISQVKRLIKQCGIVPLSTQGVIENRMLFAFSGSGIKNLETTPDTLCDEFIVFEDTYDLSHILTSKLASSLCKMGYRVICVNNPLCPEHKTDAVFVPALRLGFIPEGHIYKYVYNKEKVIKTIKTKKFTNPDTLKTKKELLSTLKKTESTYISMACNLLGGIKHSHDELEKFYINAMDYKRLDAFTNGFIEKLC